MGSERVVKTIAELIDSGHASLQTGPFGTALKAAEYSTEGVPLISVREIRNGYFELTEHTPFVNQTTLDRLPKFILRKGDIVFGRKGAVDRSAMIQESQDGWFLGSDGIRLRLDDYCDQRFISYQVRSPLVQNWLMQHAEGTTMLSMNQKVLGRIPLTLPPLPEQKAIAHILGSLDDKIELNRRMNATLEGLAQSLFQSWFVDFDPVLDNALAAGNPIPDELTDRAAVRRQALDNGTANREAAQHFPATFQFTEELGWIPEGWEILDLEKTVSAIIDHRGKTPKKLKSDWVETGYPAISAKNIKDGKLVRKDTIRFTDQELYERWMPEELQKGDLLMTSEAPLGEKLYLAKKFKWVLSQRLFGLRANEKISGIYLYHWLNTENAKADIEGRASGTTVQGIRQSELRKVKVLTPSESSVSVFSEASDSLMDKQALNESNTDIMEKLRDTLLPQLISGELRIPDAAKLAEEALA